MLAWYVHVIRPRKDASPALVLGWPHMHQTIHSTANYDQHWDGLLLSQYGCCWTRRVATRSADAMQDKPCLPVNQLGLGGSPLKRGGNSALGTQGSRKVHISPTAPPAFCKQQLQVYCDHPVAQRVVLNKGGGDNTPTLTPGR